MAKVLIDDEGTRHLIGSGLCGHSTACGDVDTGIDYQESDGLPDCDGCIDVVRTAFKSITKKELKQCR